MPGLAESAEAASAAEGAAGVVVPAGGLAASVPGEPAVRGTSPQKTVETPLGRNPTEVTYADYRTIDGITLPFRWTVARPSGRFTVQVEEMQQNAPVDDAAFAKPPAPPPPPQESPR